MKLKKLVSVALAGAMALSLTACGGGETAATTAAAKEEAKATEAPAAGEAEIDKIKPGIIILSGSSGSNRSSKS